MDSNAVRKLNRNSSFEIIRILAMLMIIVSHVYGGQTGGENLTGVYRYIYVLVNTVFGAGLGVIIFMLLSGYFLIRASAKKLANFVSTVWVCSVFYVVILAVCSVIQGIPISEIEPLKTTLKRFIPISSGFYWYVSAYFCLMLLSPFINRAINAMSRKTYTLLLAVLTACFFVLPSVVYFDIIGDKGKGLVTMTSCYLIGAYISKYNIQPKKKTLYISLAVITLISIIGNFALSAVSGKFFSEHGSVVYPFSRECSVFTLAIGVILIMLAAGKSFTNKAVNSFSSKTLYVYIIGCQLTGLLSPLNITEKFKGSIALPFIVLALSICVYLASYLCALVLKYPSALIGGLLYKIYLKLKPTALKIFNSTLHKA